MIGDSLTDVRTARAANVPVIAVGFGYSEVMPQALNADRLISSFSELPHAIAAVGTLCEQKLRASGFGDCAKL
jgi:phosphoglycolate phosphatase